MLKRLSMIISLCLMAVVIVACGSSGGTSSDSIPSDVTSTTTAVASPKVSASPSATAAPMHVTGLSVTVNPSTLSHVTCGGATNLVYTAAIFIDAGSNGGQVTFTWNANGATTPGSVTFAPGDTSKTVTYALNNVAIQYAATANTSVTLTVNNNGQTVTSAPVKPAGNCTFPGPFVVTGVSASVNPASLAGIPCNTTMTVVYTVTVTIAPNSNGGTVVVDMMVGQFHRAGNVFFSPGTTVQNLTFSITAKITHTTPPGMTFASTSPNAVSSSPVKPAGPCS